MLAETAAALSSLKAASELAKAMMDIRDASLFQSKAVDLQRQILAAQESALAANERQTALVDRVRAFEEEVASLKAWGAEKQRYELKPLRDNDESPAAYALKEAMADGEPPHWICATCYQQSKKSLLQPETREPGRCLVYVCHECGTDLYVEGGPMPEHFRRRRS